MKKKELVMLFCLALLVGCAEQPLQKPVVDQVFARETDNIEPGPSVSDLIITDKSIIKTPTVEPTESPTPTQVPDSVTPVPPPSSESESETPPPEQLPDSEPPAHESSAPSFISVDNLNVSGLSNKKLSWYFMKNSEHQPTRGAAEIDISAYDGYYLGDTSKKYIWLTFDSGYENGYTASILDTLKEKNVQAAFFCVGTYIRDNPELTKRMADEGHLVVNHSEKHPSMPDIDDHRILDEIYSPAKRYKELTGADMPLFFRPPSGEYSERAMYITKEAGYKTIFWSFAYQDWLVDEQPGKEKALKTLMDNLHNGEILLLHAVSSSNSEALPEFIDAVKAQGYEFKSLYDLP